MTGRAIGEPADTRQAVRVLAALTARTGADAVRLGNHGYRTRNDGRARPVRFSDALADALIAAGLLQGNPEERLVATDIAVNWLARHAASVDPFRAQHQETVTRRSGEAEQTLIFNVAESPLAWLRSRTDKSGQPLIDAAQFAAGERLRSDFTRAQMTPRVTACWDQTGRAKRRGGGAGGMAELTEAGIAAKTRLNNALAAVGPELSGILVDVCCFLKGISEVERERGWPARSAKLILQLALTRLARHYGLAGEARGGPRAPTGHWGSDDYRPRA